MTTVFITGASSGIGKATAKLFANNGWNVVAAMRSPEKENELSHFDNILITRLDVERPDTIKEALESGIQKFGQVDVLVNNAGYGTMGIFEAATDEQIRRQFDVNVFGLMRMTKAILPHFRANHNGLIINVSSMGGRLAFPVMSLYHASKFAVEGFTESLYYELASCNIVVKLIEPGMVKTDFGGRSLDLLFDESLTDYQEYFAKVSEGFGKMSTPESQSPPELVAETLYQAATDGSDRLRYRVGEDAKALLKLREELDDETFIPQIAGMFSIDKD